MFRRKTKQGLFLFHGLVNRVFLPSLFPFPFVLKGEKWEEKRIISLFFLLHFLFWERSGTGTENERKPLFLLFFLSFCFFSSVFLMIFSLFSFYLLFWEWEKENEISVISSLFSSFLGEKNGRINWKNLKEIRLLFLLNFRSFFFLFSLLIFSFWERKWREKRIKKFAFFVLKRFCKNIVVFKIAFLGRKIRQKFIFYAKNTLKNAKNQKIFAKNIEKRRKIGSPFFILPYFKKRSKRRRTLIFLL